MLTRRRLLAASVGGLAIAGASQRATAQILTKQVRVIVPFPPGGGTDVIARILAERLRGPYASTVIVENKAGASGNIGTDYVAKAVPDGSTIGVSIGGPLAINTLLFSKLPYDPKKDIAAITQLITQPSALAVSPEFGVNTVAELIAKLKADPSTNPYIDPKGYETELNLEEGAFKLILETQQKESA